MLGRTVSTIGSALALLSFRLGSLLCSRRSSSAGHGPGFHLRGTFSSLRPHPHARYGRCWTFEFLPRFSVNRIPCSNLVLPQAQLKLRSPRGVPGQTHILPLSWKRVPRRYLRKEGGTPSSHRIDSGFARHHPCTSLCIAESRPHRMPPSQVLPKRDQRLPCNNSG